MSTSRRESQRRASHGARGREAWTVRGPGSKAKRGVLERKAAAERHALRIASSGVRFTIGRNAFAKISAVEGLRLSPDMERDFDKFDKEGLTSENRRRAIIAKYGGKAP